MIVSRKHLDTLCGMAHGMRVLLQDRSSKRYFKCEHDWVIDPAMATDFTNMSLAIHSAAGNRHRPLDIVLKFDDSRYDLRFSIPQRPG